MSNKTPEEMTTEGAARASGAEPTDEKEREFVEELRTLIEKYRTVLSMPLMIGWMFQIFEKSGCFKRRH